MRIWYRKVSHNPSFPQESEVTCWSVNFPAVSLPVLWDSDLTKSLWRKSFLLSTRTITAGTLSNQAHEIVLIVLTLKYLIFSSNLILRNYFYHLLVLTVDIFSLCLFTEGTIKQRHYLQCSNVM